MTVPVPKGMTPAERLRASRAHIRAVLLESKTSSDSLLDSLLRPMAAERPLTLAALAALLGAAVVTAKPWRWRALPFPLMSWVNLALTAWAQSRTPKD